MLSSSTSSSPCYTQAPSRQSGTHNSHALGPSSPATLPGHTMYEKVKVTHSRSRQYQTPLWQDCRELIASSPSEWLECTLRSDGKKRCQGAGPEATEGYGRIVTTRIPSAWNATLYRETAVPKPALAVCPFLKLSMLVPFFGKYKEGHFSLARGCGGKEKDGFGVPLRCCSTVGMTSLARGSSSDSQTPRSQFPSVRWR